MKFGIDIKVFLLNEIELKRLNSLDNSKSNKQKIGIAIMLASKSIQVNGALRY
ncbi:hypothetical protein [Radiobacillus sp. PE A8.2]|uniref:hypothetical protein n=1 Tax=Radiobacillus sp. PE A8.2 TaxID=3380349 RepID=UPI00388D5495